MNLKFKKCKYLLKMLSYPTNYKCVIQRDRLNCLSVTRSDLLAQNVPLGSALPSVSMQTLPIV
jgi:hypothetical protein